MVVHHQFWSASNWNENISLKTICKMSVNRTDDDDVPVSSCSQVWRLGPSDLTH